MAIRDWSGRKLALCWVAGLLFEGSLLGLGAWNERRAESEFRERHAWMDVPARRLSPEERDSVLRVLSERHGISIVTRGDTIASVTLDSTAQQAARQSIDGFGVAVGFALLLFALIVLPVPIALVGITLVWYRERRRRARSLSAAPAG